MLLAQAAIETVKTSSYITGHFVIDGVLLIAGLKTVELIISKVRAKGNGKSMKPGESEICQKRGEVIAGLVVSKDNTEKALANIDGKLDRLIEKFIEKP